MEQKKKMTAQKERSKDKKRKDILESAIRIFSQKGYDNTTMDEVAKAANYSKRTIYAYFNSKEEIYFYIMLEGYHVLKERILNEKEIHKMNHPKDELIALFQAFYRFSKQDSFYFEAIMTYETSKSVEDEQVDPSIKVECYRMGEEILDYMAQILERGMKEGFFRKQLDIKKLVLFLWSATLGIFNTANKKSEYLLSYHQMGEQEFISSSLEWLLNSFI